LNITKGILSFVLKACTYGLKTRDNLKRWGIRKLNKCELCKNHSNLEHNLNWCPVALNEGRLKWGLDLIFSHLTLRMKSVKHENILIYSDMTVIK
jgi:hypothetical protein